MFTITKKRVRLTYLTLGTIVELLFLEEHISPFLFLTGNTQAGAANRAELREQVARQEREIALLKAKLAETGEEDGEGGSRLEVLEVRFIML